MSPRRPTRSFTGAGAIALIGALALVAPQGAVSVPFVPPSASLNATPNPAMVGQTVNFDGSGSTGDGTSTITDYEWDLDGNGSFETDTGTTPTTSRSYSAAATIQVKLRVTDSDHATTNSDSDTDEDSISVRINAPPVAGFIFEPSTPTVGEQVTFSSTSSDPDGTIPPASQRWDLDNDGQFDDATGSSPSTSFAAVGNHTVGLEVTDADGATAVATRVVPVQNNLPPHASFVISPTAPRAGEVVELASTSFDPDGPIVSQTWDLDGDGQFDDGQGAVVEHTFQDPGTAQLGLRVVDSGGAADVITKAVVIEARPLELMSPFPIVRLSGELRPSGKTLIERLTVTAPKQSDVTVLCHGKSCSFHERHRTAWFSRVRFRGFNEALDPGTKIEIFVTDPTKIGKFTSFKLRNGKAPKRKDRCLAGEAHDPIGCAA
jgi:PKD repeat protein